MIPTDPLDYLKEVVADCTKCKLCATRTKTVFEGGARAARLMFIGEAPSQSEDESGTPFVGKSGQLFDKMLAKVFQLDRSQVYVTNTVKCRPPKNREPLPEEIVACFGYLQQQIILVAPRVIVTLGRVATHSLLDSKTPIGKMRGKLHRYGEIAVIPTTHPSYWLRNPPDKKMVVQDMEFVKSFLSTKT